VSSDPDKLNEIVNGQQIFFSHLLFLSVPELLVIFVDLSPLDPGGGLALVYEAVNLAVHLPKVVSLFDGRFHLADVQSVCIRSQCERLQDILFLHRRVNRVLLLITDGYQSVVRAVMGLVPCRVARELVLDLRVYVERVLFENLHATLVVKSLLVWRV